jgi:hypothetical protein
MKAFLVLLVLSAAGVAGVVYFRRYIAAQRTAAVAPIADPTKDGKERRRRRRHGARRLARNTLAAPPSRSLPGEAPPGEAPAGESPAGEAPPRVFDSPSDERAPLAPGGSAITEAAPDDVFGEVGGTPSQAPSGGRRQAIAEPPPPIKLRPGDLKIVWQGEDLSRAETQRLDFSNDAGGHELTDAEIDSRFRTKEDAVLGCIARARPNEDADIPGRVTVKFRIQPAGSVKGVQVEAPVILHKGGLTGCIRNVMSSLRFPKSGTGQVVSFPFSLM